MCVCGLITGDESRVGPGLAFSDNKRSGWKNEENERIEIYQRKEKKKMYRGFYDGRRVATMMLFNYRQFARDASYVQHRPVIFAIQIAYQLIVGSFII